MAERMNFEEFCNRVVQEINQEKALGESVASYEDKKIRVTETVNGPSTKAMEQVAKEEGIYIIFGMSEKLHEEDTDIYNSAVVLGPEGLIGSYQKIHPYGTENMWCNVVKLHLCLIRNGARFHWQSAMTTTNFQSWQGIMHGKEPDCI